MTKCNALKSRGPIMYSITKIYNRELVQPPVDVSKTMKATEYLNQRLILWTVILEEYV